MVRGISDGLTPTVPGAGGGGASDLADLGDVTNADTATDGQILTANGDDTFTFEDAPGGSGITIEGTITDGQTVVWDDTDNVYIPILAGGPVFNPRTFRSGRRARGYAEQTTVTITAASNSGTLASATNWGRGHGCVIPGAGADHGLSTPSAPTIIPQTMGAQVIGEGSTTWETSVTATFNTSTNLITTSQPMTLANGTGIKFYNVGGAMPTYATTTAFVAGTTYYVRTTTTTTYSLHPTALDATNNTNAYDIDGAGTGTHYFEIIGSTTYEAQVACGSGNGGCTAASSAGQTTTGNATIDGVTHLVLLMDMISGEHGRAIYGFGTSNRFLQTMIPSVANCRKFVADAGGYTNLNPGDLGRTLVQGTHDGIVIAYDNATRTIWVEPTSFDADTYPGGAAVSWTITGGTGAGTQTSASTLAIYYRYRGSVSATPNKTLERRSSTEYFPGDLYMSPFSASGNLYRVHRIFDTWKSASSAPTYATTLGALTLDGLIEVRRENIAYPVTPPGSQINDGLFTYITDLSGTTATFADAAVASVTAGTIFPDDTDSLQATWTEANAHHAAAGDMLITGECPIVSGMMYGASTDARWGSPTGGGLDQWALFDFTELSGAKSSQRRWVGQGGARITWYPLDGSSYITSSDGEVTNYALFRLAHGSVDIRDIEFRHAPLAEPHLEKGERNQSTGSAFNNENLLICDSSVNMQVSGPRFFNCGVHGFARLYNMLGSVNYGFDELLDNCFISGGGSDGDGIIYTNGGLFRNCVVIGTGFTRSLCFYQDTNVFTTPLRIEGGFYRGWRKNGLARVRYHDFYCGGGVIIQDCVKIYGSDNPDGWTVRDAHLIRTSLEPNGADQVTIDNVWMEDGTLTLASSAGVRIHNLRAYVTASQTRFTGTTVLCTITGGSDISISQSRFESLNNGSVQFRGLSLSGVSTGAVRFTDTDFIGMHSLGAVVASTFSAHLDTKGCLFQGATGPEAHQFTLNAAGTWKSVDDRFVATTTSNEVAFNGGARIELVNPTITGKLSIESGITGPFIIKGGDSSSSSAAAIGDPIELIEHNFAVAPTISVAGVYTRGCTVAGSHIASPSALASGTTDNYQLPVTDYVRLDPNASNSVLGGLVAFAGGTEKTLINVDAGAATFSLDDDGAGSTAANRYTFAALSVAAGEQATVLYDPTSALWRLKCKSA